MAFWGSNDVEWTTCNLEGASRGMDILWRRDYLSLNYSFVGKGYVSININWKRVCHNLVNVYTPCNMVERCLLWSSLLDRKRKNGCEEWCAVGDFNEVLYKEEKVGEDLYDFNRGIEEFRAFLETMELVVIPCAGGKFTWFKDNGKAVNRLDKFLLSRKLLDKWGWWAKELRIEIFRTSLRFV